MATSLRLANVLSVGATQTRTLGEHLADALSITDFHNADGSLVLGDWNGTTGRDNSTGIQAAIDFAMPNTGTTTGTCRPLFIPPGNYKILTSLHIQGVSGTTIYGAGKNTSTITFTGSGTTGNTIGQDTGPFAGTHLFTPVFMLNGVRDCRFQDFSVSGTTANRTSLGSKTIGWCFLSPAFAKIGTGVTPTECTWLNTGCYNFASSGFIFGQNANCENMTLINTDIDQCDYAGVLASNLNSLNHVVIGGKISNCGSTGTYTDPSSGSGNGIAGGLMGLTGTFLFVTGVEFENNFVDVVNAASNCNVVGCLHKGAGASGSPIFNAAIVSTGGSIFVSGCTYQGASNRRFIDVIGGPVHATSCTFDPPSNTGAGKLIWAYGSATMDNWVVNSTAIAAGCNVNVWGAAAILMVRNCDFGGSPFPPATGTFSAPFSQVVGRPVTIAELPTASSAWSGIRWVVTDHNGSVTFGGTPSHTSGTNQTVPVFCNGAAWRIGG